ncbi:GtrA family protein [Dongia sedimenti]|uniref:GtrA family protein n=1 Tax=Dongia sedimenti TaxID=3064282 RepID=A0ABU0YT88_9PROT|nr:GtrA family protein [Rhodospirillaceae bacterium R-7]
MRELAGRVVGTAKARLEPILFVAVGGFAALVNVLARIALSRAMSYELAVVGAYLIGMTTAFALSKAFVFSASGRSTAVEYVRFGLVNVLAIVQVYAVSVLLVRAVFPWVGFDWHPETTAHIVGVVVPVFTSYLGHKHFTFAAGRR